MDCMTYDFADFLETFELMPLTCTNGFGCRMSKNELVVYYDITQRKVHNEYMTLDDATAHKNYPAYLLKIQEIESQKEECFVCGNKYRR